MKKLIAICFHLILCATIASAQKIPDGYAAQLIFLRPYFNDPGALERLGGQAAKTGNGSFQKLVEIVSNTYFTKSYEAKNKNAEKELLGIISRLRDDEKELKAQAMLSLSQHYWLNNITDKALEWGIRAYNVYGSLDAKSFPLKRPALYELASKFYYYCDFVTARKYFIEVAALPDTFSMVGTTTLLNSIGLCYRNTQQYDSAVQYFNKALKTVDSDSIWMGLLYGNLGITYYFQNRFDEAIPLLQADIERSLWHDAIPDNAANSLAVLGDIYFKKGDFQKANNALVKANEILQEKYNGTHAKLILAIYPRLAKLYEREGKYQLANQLIQTAADTKDSLLEKTNALTLAGVQLKLDAEKRSGERKILEQQRVFQNYIRNSLIAGILLLATLIILFLNRQKLRHQYRASRSEEELKEAARQLEVFTAALHQKTQMLEDFKEQLTHLQEQQYNSSEVQDHETITQLQQLTLITEAEWENFRVLFEKVHAGFLYRLKQKMPELSPADIRFLALTKLNFSYKEIASTLGVGVGAVRTTKSRLRKKLNLPEDGSIEDLIQNV